MHCRYPVAMTTKDRTANMKKSTLIATLALICSATPAYAMKGCDPLDGTHASIGFALKAVEARQRGDSRESLAINSTAEGLDPEWNATMVKETLDEVFSALPLVEPAVYSGYRSFICYRASLQPNTEISIDYAAIHPSLKACESRQGPWERTRCGTEAVDSYLRTLQR